MVKSKKQQGERSDAAIYSVLKYVRKEGLYMKETQDDGQWLREPVGEIMAFPNHEDPSVQVDKPPISKIKQKPKQAPKMKTVKI